MSLKVNNLGFCYRPESWVFRNVSIEVPKGGRIGIYGNSGCGKTTLAKILASFISPKEGEVVVDGENQKREGFQPVQLIFQHPEKTMNPLWRMKDSLCESYVPEKSLLDAFGIRDEWMERYPIELSGGELQRFSIVRALHPEAKYIIADEMTTMLDAITQASIWKGLLEIVKERNLGLIVISHEMAIIDKICDSCLNLEDYCHA